MQSASQSAPATTGAGRRPPAVRKSLGAWYTPTELVDLVVGRTITPEWVRARRSPISVLDPACGDGRFLRAAARRIAELGGVAELTGLDIDAEALASAAVGEPFELIAADALDHPWGERRFDLVVGNPPFLSQLATGTTRGGASPHGGGPYADAAAEFLSLAVQLAAVGGRIGMILPQSILASRDAGGVRRQVEQMAPMRWSWWSPERHFDADVLVCALGFERTQGDLLTSVRCEEGRLTSGAPPTWSHVVVRELGIPDLPDLEAAGSIGERATLNANFRDEYYGMIPAVADDADGPPLVSSGLIDPGRCWWGERPVRFAKRSFAAPRVEVGLLDERMQAWARRKLVPKVLVASQTTILEAVVDAHGAWLPAVPVTTVVPHAGTDPWALGAVLTSPVASVAAWHGTAGTGLSARAIRVGPAVLAAIPWPAGDLTDAVSALRAGDIRSCGDAVNLAYGVEHDHPNVAAMIAWWCDGVSRAAAAAKRRSFAPASSR